MNDFSIRRASGGRIIWSQDQIQYIIDEYQKHFSTPVIAAQFKVCAQSVRSLLKKHNVKILSLYEFQTRLFPRDNSYFKTIDCEDKAYWLGFICADGYIQNTELRINLQKSDESHLCKFLQAIQAHSTPIKYSHKLQNGKKYEQAYIGFRDKYLIADLAKLNCVNKKSLVLEFPNDLIVPVDLKIDFIRGYFDGDGSIHIANHYHSTKRPNYKISITGTKSMLDGIKTHLQVNHLTLEHNHNHCVLHIGGNRQVYRVCELIYNSSNEQTRLQRKYEKFLELKSLLGHER